jgi:hypothetical protein
MSIELGKSKTTSPPSDQEDWNVADLHRIHLDSPHLIPLHMLSLVIFNKNG